MTKEFNPQIGDTIVTKERGNYICANYEEYVEREGLNYNPRYASKPICGVRESGHGFTVWDKYGKCSRDEYSIVEIIPAQKPEIKIDTEISQGFKIKVLELENLRQPHRGWRFVMLRTLLRKEGVEI